jgi:uncharacterized protein
MDPRNCHCSGYPLEAFVDRLIDVVEVRKLAFGGGAGRDDQLDGFVTRMGRGSATEDDRAALGAFLAGDDAVVRHEVGPLRDAWHGWGWKHRARIAASP